MLSLIQFFILKLIAKSILSSVSSIAEEPFRNPTCTIVSKQFSFTKEEKLKSRKMIAELFKRGKTVKSFPIRIHFLFPDQKESPVCQVGVSVPKRNFKRAVDRNRIKRQIREAYRLQKLDFLAELEKSEKRMVMMMVFSAREKCDYIQIEKSMSKALNKINL